MRSVTQSIGYVKFAGEQNGRKFTEFTKISQLTSPQPSSAEFPRKLEKLQDFDNLPGRYDKETDRRFLSGNLHVATCIFNFGIGCSHMYARFDGRASQVDG